MLEILRSWVLILIWNFYNPRGCCMTWCFLSKSHKKFILNILHLEMRICLIMIFNVGLRIWSCHCVNSMSLWIYLIWNRSLMKIKLEMMLFVGRNFALRTCLLELYMIGNHNVIESSRNEDFVPWDLWRNKNSIWVFITRWLIVINS